MKTTLYIVCAIIFGAMVAVPRPKKSAQMEKEIVPVPAPPPMVAEIPERTSGTVPDDTNEFERKAIQNIKYLNAKERALDSILKNAGNEQ